MNSDEVENLERLREEVAGRAIEERRKTGKKRYGVSSIMCHPENDSFFCSDFFRFFQFFAIIS